MNVILFLLVYIIIMLLYSIWLYNQVKIFIRIFIGNLLFFPWKILLPVLISVFFNLHLNYYNKTLKSQTTNQKQRKIITSLTSFYTNILFILMNFKIVGKKVDMKKYIKNI